MNFQFFKVYLKYKGYLTFIFCKLGINIVIKTIHTSMGLKELNMYVFETNPLLWQRLIYYEKTHYWLIISHHDR